MTHDKRSDNRQYSTLIFGYGDVVQNKYLVNLPETLRSETAFVEQQPLPNTEDTILAWGTSELNNFIQEQKISTFIIAATPDSHASILEYLSQTVNTHAVRIFVEKPFVPSSELYKQSFIQQLLEKNNVDVYCIDHYLAKPVILWLKAHIQNLVSQYGYVTGIHYTSFETKGFSSLNTYRIGYALEHGVHALPCFEYLLGPLFTSMNQVKNDSAEVNYHTMEGEQFINTFDAKFTVNTSDAKASNVLPQLDASIRCGKLHTEDEKHLSIQFEKATLVAGFNDNSIRINGEEVDTTSMLEADAYTTIFHSLYNDSLQQGFFLKPNDAMRAVAFIESGIEFANAQTC